MPHDAAPEIEPSSTEYSTAWVAYALAATGALGFFLGPLVALILSYSRRDADRAGFMATHHRWLIRTFWWTVAAYLACIAVILAGVWPLIGDVIVESIRRGGPRQDITIGFEWSSLFATVSAALIGGLGILGVWVWNIYRIVRGAFLLGDRRPAP